MLVPNDPLYASQWHYMSPPAEMGGVNLPPAWDHHDRRRRASSSRSSTPASCPHIRISPGRFVGGYDFIGDSRGRQRRRRPRRRSRRIPATGSPRPRARRGYFAGCPPAHQHVPRHARGRDDRRRNQQRHRRRRDQLGEQDPARRGCSANAAATTSDIVDAIRWSAGLTVARRADQCRIPRGCST